MDTLLSQIGIIVGIAAIVALAGRFIRQPSIIAYLITGVLVGPLVFNLIDPATHLQSLSTVGIALLAIVCTASFLIARALDFSLVPSLYIALAFSFSSAVVVVKILSDKKEMETLHGQIALGILIVESFIAALALMIIPVITSGGALVISLQ